MSESRIDPQGPVTSQQAEIVEQAGELLDVLDEVVPSTTIHYAVEQARSCLRTLIRTAPGILTHDKKAEHE